jgi:hypothetical protein
MFKCLHAKKCSAATSNLEKLFIGAQPDTHVECVFVLENDIVFGCSDRLEKFPFAQLNEFVKTLDGIEGDGRFVVYSDGPRQGDFDCTFEIDLGPDFNERRRVFKDMGGETSLYIKDKEKYIKENEDEDFHKFIGNMVKCEHCKSVFKFNSYKVSSGIIHNTVRCANYPDCRGSIEDFAISRAKKEKTNPEVTKIRDIRMQHEVLQGNPIVAEYKVHAKSGITTLVSRSEKQLTFFIIKKEMYNSLRPQIRVLFASAVKNFDLTVISSYMALCPVLAVRLTNF